MIIKLALKNMKNSFFEDRKVYLLMLTSQLVAVVSIFFLYGIFSSYSAKMQELDYESYSIHASFSMSKFGTFKECLPQILTPMENRLDYVVVLGSWNEIMISIYTSYDNGEFHSADTIEKNIQMEHAVAEGRYLSEEDEALEKTVLYSLRKSESSDGDGGEIFEESMDKVGDRISIGGIEYEVIGVDSRIISGGVTLPFTSCSDDVNINYVSLLFRELPTQQDYLVFKNGLEDAFGEDVSVDEFALKDEEELISIRSIIVISVTVGVVSALNLCLLYGYIIGRRRKQMAIYGILGASDSICLAIQEMEILLVSIGTAVVSLLIFRVGLQEFLSSIYTVGVSIYGIKAYLVMLSIYLACIFVITWIMLIFTDNEKLSDRIRRTQND